MDVESQLERRDATVQRRRAPGAPVRLRFPFSDPVTVDDETASGPIQLELEVTGGTGDFAVWLDDEWWAEAITHWADDDVTVLVGQTPSALAHPILRHQLDMLRRVVPSWRLVAYAYRDDIEGDVEMEAVATSPYHEIRFIDELRSNRASAARVQPVPALPVLFSRIRKVQSRRRVSTPILVRLPAPSPDAATRLIETHGAVDGKTRRSVDVPTSCR